MKRWGLMVSFAMLALMMGASARADGPARGALGGLCGTAAGIECQDGLWCDRQAGTCGEANAPGVCIEVPQFCTREYLPVCGCDGKTYGNDCDRRASRAAKRHDGECRSG